NQDPEEDAQLLSTTAYDACTLTNYLVPRVMGWAAWCRQMKAPAAATLTEHDDRARQRIAGAWRAPAGSRASASNMVS
ncbi:unnamed protein product, partial [Ectocarpus sp. 4 AP-2014]